MKRIVVLVPVFLITSSIKAQLGDFQLRQLSGRSYVMTSADSTLEGNGFNRFLIGKNYRNEWTDSIRVPVLNLKKDFGGLAPEKEGGGKQTHTLHLKDAQGRDWVLRSVEKFPDKVLAPEFKGTIAKALVKDGISASYPFSALSVGTLSKAAGIPYLQNTVVYIPDDPKLGEFRSRYKNTLALFELRTIENNKDKKTYDTQEIIPGLQQSNKNAVDQKAVLRVRLLDNFIMDFDRHEGQWMWVKKDDKRGTYYYPIAKDRDQAFFRAEGFLPEKLSHKPSLGQLQGFRARPKNILTFNYAARNFDHSFLNELDEQTWSNEIDQFLSSMKDDVIENAINNQPKEIQKYHGDQIAGMLKKKRVSFRKDMLHYYRFLSKTVSIVGSNEAEKFMITKNTDGTVKVETRDKNELVVYSRLFDPLVTREIIIYGLEGDDQFLITGETSPIKVRLIGGPGSDVFENKSKAGKIYVYDVSFEKNILTGNGFKNEISSDPLNNEYRRISTEYNSSSAGIYPEYSRDGGLFLGPSYTITTHSFRKEPYASKHFFYITKALTSSAWHLHYDADFIKIANNTDLLFRSDATLPTVRTQFFGYGNNTVFDKRRALDYYALRYTLVDASLMIRNFLAPWLQLEYGPMVEHFKVLQNKNANHYIRNVYPFEGSSVYGSKWYTGGEVRASINTRNSEVIPTRGISSSVYSRQLIGIGKSDNSFNQVGGDFSMYTDAVLKKHIIIATSFGADYNFGDFEIPQAQYLGFRQNLRGYSYQRFAGRARAYNNTELRINLTEINLYLVKGPFGLLGFHDVGRVWADGENSSTWHTGYGGGLWMAPFNKVVVNALLSFSKEEKAFPMATLGFQF